MHFVEREGDSQQTFLVFQDVFKTYSQYVFLKRLQDVFKTSSRRFQDIFKTSSKTSSRHLQDVFKTSLQDVLQLCLQDVFSTSSPRRMFAGLLITTLVKKKNIAKITQNSWISLFFLWSFNQSEARERMQNYSSKTKQRQSLHVSKHNWWIYQYFINYD